jgi:hypothetical protein
MKSFSRHCLAAVLSLGALTANGAWAQSGPSFVYALQQITGGTNQVHGFSVNAATGVLTAVPGSPFSAGTGTALALSFTLAYDPIHGRLFALNASTVSAYDVDRLTGALVPLPFSPIALPASTWNCLQVSPDGATVVAASAASGNDIVASFTITNSAATAAPGSPYVAPASPFWCTFSPDGARFYTGGNDGDDLAGFAVATGTAALTPLPGSPFATGLAFPEAAAVDASGRLFVASASAVQQVRVFTSPAGTLTPVATIPAGLTAPAAGILHPAGAYMVVDRSGNRVGVYRITGTGNTTSVAPVAGSPFASGGTYSDALTLDESGTRLFVANGDSRNIQTSRVNSDLSLTPLSLQPVNTLGSVGRLTGIAYVRAGMTPQYRLYHTGTAEHLVTTDPGEYTYLGTVGWVQEGVAYQLFRGPGLYGGQTAIPLYRLYDLGQKHHFWTTDALEVSVLSGSGAFIYEGIPGYVLPGAVPATTAPLERLFLPSVGLHHWTASEYEVQALIIGPWRREGVIGHVGQ